MTKMTNKDYLTGLHALINMLAYTESEHSPKQYKVHKKVLEYAIQSIEKLDKIERLYKNCNVKQMCDCGMATVFEKRIQEVLEHD